MADVTLGRAGQAVLIDLDICAKTGRETSDRVELRGSTTPAWVTLLLLFTVVGFLLAGAMTSRPYRVTLPLTHAVHDRWSRNRRLTRIVGLGGLSLLLWATATESGAAALGAGFLVVVAALVGGLVNATANSVGFRVTPQDDLVLTRTHRNFARAAAAATVEAMPTTGQVSHREAR